ncbi:hypothetical protein ACFWA9_04455 [Kitasatospora sp. NPDC059973]|uniref:hypothetical protein n=1 Tax=Kitasatospora sp. NPDC059973 TaxID=3347020 RepID=UPI0036808870
MQVRSETGAVVARAGCGLDWDSALAGLERDEFSILTGVCPYMDTVFNSWQRSNLPAKLDRLPADRGGPWVREIRALCVPAHQALHRYVWLLGD